MSKVRVSGDIDDSNIGNSVVSQGPCAQDCPGVELGMYTGWGLSRASNKGESEWRNCSQFSILQIDFVNTTVIFIVIKF